MLPPARFSAAPALTQQIAPNPTVDPNSTAIIAPFQTGQVVDKFGLIWGLGPFSIPVYEVGSDEIPRQTVTATDTFAPQIIDLIPCPLLPSFIPSFGSDRHMIVVDFVRRLVYEFEGFQWVGTAAQCTTGAVFSLDSDGVSHWPEGANYGLGPLSRANGSGVSILGTLLRTSEIAHGYVGHALSVSVPQAAGPAQNLAVVRYPATTTDGIMATPDTSTPWEGMRIQHQPKTAMAGTPSPGEMICGTALQQFGAYVTDQTGAPLDDHQHLIIACESPGDVTTPEGAAAWAIWAEAFGFTAPTGPPPYTEYITGTDAIRCFDLRVLASWDGS